MIPIYSSNGLAVDQQRENIHRNTTQSSKQNLDQLFNLSRNQPTKPSNKHTIDESFAHSLDHSNDHSDDTINHPVRNYVTVVAPMVRYSKLPFRLLTREYGADLAFSPMIVASGFVRSQQARESEFSTCSIDQPLIAQFASADCKEIGEAAELISPLVQGIDLNCGCPQRWAMSDGLGSALIKRPELIASMVKSMKARVTVPVSIKIRLNQTIDQTIELVRRAEAVGVDFITVHGRTPAERHSPVNIDAIKLVKSIAQVPIIANGDVHTPKAMREIADHTGVDGLMSARGILANPALFDRSGQYDCAPISAMGRYIQLAAEYGGKYHLHHHHIMYMLHHRLTRAERFEFMAIKSMPGICDFFDQRGWEWRQSKEMT